MTSLPRIRTGLLRHPLDQQVLVYDTGSERVHLLDQTSACVFELLQEGGWTREGIAIELAERLGAPQEPEFLALAIEELRQAALLDETNDEISKMPEVSRREAIRNLALTGAAAMLLPGVATLTATKGYAQGSVLFANGSACPGGNSQCQSNICCAGTCASVCNEVVGGACPSGNAECASGICCSGFCASVACGSLVACATCQTDQECGDGNCNANNLCGTGNGAANGQICSGNGNCCSGRCVKVGGGDGTCQPAL